ncbi:MAG: adenylate/guanylate cyclase domain-containing protein [Pseudolabrys sp.]|jgi:class 3 adenylate cyclase
MLAPTARTKGRALRDVIGTINDTITNVIVVFGGFVARYVGDSALIYFGFPQADEDGAEQAIRAALQVVETVSGLEPLHGHKAEVRIGIATGLVVVGNVAGGKVPPELDVTGETPNLAARLPSVAKPNFIIIAATHGGLRAASLSTAISCFTYGSA